VRKVAGTQKGGAFVLMRREKAGWGVGPSCACLKKKSGCGRKGNSLLETGSEEGSTSNPAGRAAAEGKKIYLKISGGEREEERDGNA